MHGTILFMMVLIQHLKEIRRRPVAAHKKQAARPFLHQYHIFCIFNRDSLPQAIGILPLDPVQTLGAAVACI
jgi:hypothetical protein